MQVRCGEGKAGGAMGGSRLCCTWRGCAGGKRLVRWMRGRVVRACDWCVGGGVDWGMQGDVVARSLESGAMERTTGYRRCVERGGAQRRKEGCGEEGCG